MAKLASVKSSNRETQADDAFERNIPWKTACVSRDVLCNIPPSSDGRICCLAGFLGEFRDSGRGLGLDAWGKLAVLSACHERSLGQCRGRGLRFDIRADNG